MDACVLQSLKCAERGEDKITSDSVPATELMFDAAGVRGLGAVKSLTSQRCFVFYRACTKLARDLENLVAPCSDKRTL